MNTTPSGSGLRPERPAPVPALGIAHQPPVALGPEGPGPDEDRVDVLAQPVEHLTVAGVAQVSRTSPECRPPVGARDEVDDRVRPIGVAPGPRG